MILALLAAAQVRVKVTDLNVSPATAFMNDAGAVAGRMYEGNHYRCFFWKNNKLVTLADDVTEVCGINSKDQLAIVTKSGPAIWTNGKIEHSGKEFQGARPAGIDDNGRMVGEISTGSEGMFRVGYWPPVKNPPANYYPPRPAAVASDGSFVGTRSFGLQFRQSDQPLGWIETPKGVFPIGDVARQASPTCLSPNHHVGGSFQSGRTYRPRPFAWFDGVFNELPLPGGAEATGGVVGINDRGDAVGTADWQEPTPTGTLNQYKAVLWHGGKLTILQDLIDPALKIDVEQAYAINKSGQILVRISPSVPRWPRSLAVLTPG